ncbi:CRISPR-associated helicase/endonuclease Cas3 [Paludifilum halophilum]|uniref:CRISPR-associated helicase/endonuclease Cas3 n=1 Tax=Paludifilum halophilum TaxID=1642702 RepID=A0A235B6E7_9BACL|nr:CRISPR-associated helicase/endonuclease Cas3 [Paludifilum halophilum]OYD07559.1 CRISPR-associated helicase/endonuclease Cas3 [Paludifilum halophilum]
MVYAKSEPVETIREHTEQLLTEYKRLRKAYGDRLAVLSERDWELLEMIVRYHDVGKADGVFQNRIRQQRGEEKLFVAHDRTIPHNYLSVGLVPFHRYDLTENEKRLFIHAVGYHHERKQEPVKAFIQEALETDLLPKREAITRHMELPVTERLSVEFVDYLQKRYTPSDPEFFRYIMLKGLLHRLDHAASAHVPVEAGVDEPVGIYTDRFMDGRGFQKNELQRFAEANRDRNVIAIAQTGMGKTEAALLWAGEDKTFFTLPLRVSINAIYSRITEDEGMAYSAAGLLHSTAQDYLDENGGEHWEKLYDQSRQLSNKLLLTTIDQILKFPFYYRGFEKELATMAGAKVIIDEIQVYDPDIAAMLVKSLEMIRRVGGRFMVMTATMPTLYLEELRALDGIDMDRVAQGEFVDPDLTRHRIQLRESVVEDHLDEVAERGRDKQVLIIVNTVRRAVQLYERLHEIAGDEVYLLHSQFTREDRQLLEGEIRHFNEQEKHPGVWITTQLVEASIDIDFDELHTELSVLDSFFQRLGRCYRKRKLDHQQPNVFVYTDLNRISGIGRNNVYDRSLVEKGLALLDEYDGAILDEPSKVELVRKLYHPDYLSGTDFLEQFEEAMDFFDSLDPFKMTEKEAQQKLRKIQNITVIPGNLFDEWTDEVEVYRTAPRSEKRAFRKAIQRQTISLPQSMFYGKDAAGEPLQKRLLRRVVDNPRDPLSDVWVLDAHYEFNPETCQGKGISFQLEKQDLFT